MRFPHRLVRTCGLLAAAACSKPAPPSVDVDGAHVGAASEGVLLRKVSGECSTVPCESKACPVRCPEGSAFVVVDVQEPLRGSVTVLADGVVVLARVVREIPTTGLSASVGVRPRRWPTEIEVRVDEQAARIRVDEGARFLVARRAADGGLGLEIRRDRPSYE